MECVWKITKVCDYTDKCKFCMNPTYVDSEKGREELADFTLEAHKALEYVRQDFNMSECRPKISEIFHNPLID